MLVLFFFIHPPTPEIYTLSLHDALPISLSFSWRALHPPYQRQSGRRSERRFRHGANGVRTGDRKSTRLNSSHSSISYAVFCLKKKNELKCQPLTGRDADRNRRRTRQS